MRLVSTLLLAVATIGAAPDSRVAAAEPAADNVFPYGAFEMLDAKGNPIGWNTFQETPNTKIAVENGNHYAVVAPADARFKPFFNTKFPLDAAWKTIVVSARLRVQGLKKGEQAWQTARVSLAFYGEDNKLISYGGGPRLEADSDWTTVATDPVKVPAGARFLSIEPANYGKAGEVWVDDIKVIANVWPNALAGVLRHRSRTPKATSFPKAASRL